MQIDTRSTPFALTNPGGNVTATTITVAVPTVTLPSGDGVISLGQAGATQGGLAPSSIQIVPFGAGAATNTFSMAIYGWRQCQAGLGNPTLWVPVLLAQFVCTLSSTPGVAGTDVGSTQLFVDTIQLVVGNSGISEETVSPRGGNIAHVVVSTKGHRFLEVRFGTGGSATSTNALVATL